MRRQAFRLGGGDQGARHIVICGWRSGLVEAEDRADPRASDRCGCNENVTRLKVEESAAGANANERLGAKVEQLFHND
jgi:hypothetical protein